MNSAAFSSYLLTPFRTDFVKARKVYERLGQYDYQNPDYTDDITELIGKGTKGSKLVYFGQVKSGTNKKDGIGISVRVTGDTPICIKIIIYI